MRFRFGSITNNFDQLMHVIPDTFWRTKISHACSRDPPCKKCISATKLKTTEVQYIRFEDVIRYGLGEEHENRTAIDDILGRKFNWTSPPQRCKDVRCCVFERTYPALATCRRTMS